MTKYMNILISGLIMATLFLASCSEGTSDLGVGETENFIDETLIESSFAAQRGGGCIDLVYPVTILFSDGTSLEVASKEEQKEAIQTWFDNNGRDADKPTLQYPLSAVNSAGETVTLASQDELSSLLQECKGSRGGRGGSKKSCVELVYPVTLVFPDNTTQEVSDADAKKAATRAWIEANGRDAGKPTLQYPLQVTNADGETVDVADADALKELKQSCRGDRPTRCFSVVYPVTIQFPDGTSQEVASRREFSQASRQWKRDNPDSEEKPSLAFPVNVELSDGTTQSVASQEDLSALKDSCTN